MSVPSRQKALLRGRGFPFSMDSADQKALAAAGAFSLPGALFPFPGAPSCRLIN